MCVCVCVCVFARSPLDHRSSNEEREREREREERGEALQPMWYFVRARTHARMIVSATASLYLYSRTPAGENGRRVHVPSRRGRAYSRNPGDPMFPWPRACVG